MPFARARFHALSFVATTLIPTCLFVVCMLALSPAQAFAVDSQPLVTARPLSAQTGDDIYDQGTCGTCAWEISSTGVLTIHAGELDANIADNDHPWGWNTDKVTSVRAVAENGQKIVCPRICNRLFINMSNLKTADLTGFDVSKTVDMEQMFRQCTSLQSVIVGSWNAPQMHSVSEMFMLCSSLKALDFSKFTTTSQFSNATSAFESCAALTSLDLSGWDTSGLFMRTNMFSGCRSLNTFKVGKNYSFWDENMVPFPLNVNELWWSSNVKTWCSRQAIVAGRSKIADTYSAAPDVALDLADATITLSSRSQAYDGRKKTPGVTVKYGDKTLKVGVDYRVIYSSRTTVGSAPVTIKGIVTKNSGYSGTRVEPFKIVKADIANAKIGKIKSVVYAGTAVKPNPKITYKTLTLKKGDDYTLSYKNNGAVGKATLVIEGKGNFRGKKTVPFKIATGDIGKAKVDKVSAKTYTGKAIKPKPSVELRGVGLKAGRDYKLAYKKNVDAGTATIEITGIGNYIGGKNVHFEIKRAPMSNAKIAKMKPLKFTGKLLCPKPMVTYKGMTLANNVDYRLTYRNNKNVGTAKVIISGLGNFKGSVMQAFEIVKGDNPMKVSALSKTFDEEDLEKSGKIFEGLNVSGAKGAVTTKVLQRSKQLSLDGNRNVVVAKGTKVGVYTMVVECKASGSNNYKAATKTVKVVVRVVTTMQEVENNDDYARANELPLDTWMAGSFSSSIDADWFVVDVPQAGTYKVTFNPNRNSKFGVNSKACVYGHDFATEPYGDHVELVADFVNTGEKNIVVSETVALSKGKNYIWITNGDEGYSYWIRVDA